MQKKIDETKATESREPTTKEQLQALLDSGHTIQEAAGMCRLKRSEAQRIIDYD